MARRLRGQGRQLPVPHRHPPLGQHDPVGEALQVRQLRLDAGDEHPHQQGQRSPTRDEAGQA